jgi:TolA-binding protein
MKFASLFRTVFPAVLAAGFGVSILAQGLQVDVEEFKRLQGEVADLRDANTAYRKRFEEMTRRIEKLQEDVRESHDRSTMKMGDLVTREELKKVIDRIADVDEKRESDRKVILEEFEKLGKTLSASALSSTKSNSRGNPREREPEKQTERQREKETKPEVIEGKFLEYVVKPDEPFSVILQNYNEHLKKEGLPTIRQSDVMKVNPNLNPNRIFVGQKIQLPVPEKKR